MQVPLTLPQSPVARNAMRRKTARETPVPAPASADAPAGIALPTMLSAAVTGGCVLALALTGTLVVGGTATPFGSAMPILHPRGPVATAPRAMAEPAPITLPPPQAPARVSLIRHATPVVGRTTSAGAVREDEGRTPSPTTHRQRKDGGPTPDPGGTGGGGTGGGGTGTDPGGTDPGGTDPGGTDPGGTDPGGGQGGGAGGGGCDHGHRGGDHHDGDHDGDHDKTGHDKTGHDKTGHDKSRSGHGKSDHGKSDHGKSDHGKRKGHGHGHHGHGGSGAGGGDSFTPVQA
jgi:hypothetical protein